MNQTKSKIFQMEFNPNNNIVKLCILGMEMEEKGKPGEAINLFLQGWDEASNDFEKYLAAFYVSRHQLKIGDKLKWLETTLQFALTINNYSTQSALPSLFENIAQCYEELGEHTQAKKNFDLAISCKNSISDNGPFYHGTKADLEIGNLLTAGGVSNYKTNLIMNHIYFTALMNGAALAAALSKGKGNERVYIIEPTGNFENDPNVTNKRFPGNPTRSYRSESPLKIIVEATGWIKIPADEIQKWHEKLANNKGEIIN